VVPLWPHVVLLARGQSLVHALQVGSGWTAMLHRCIMACVTHVCDGKWLCLSMACATDWVTLLEGVNGQHDVMGLWHNVSDDCVVAML
jgi:hypothetical protein